MYPVGSIYISVSDTNPAELYGGSWEAFGAGRTLVSVDPKSSDPNLTKVGNLGGEQFHVQTVGQLAPHSHGVILASKGSRPGRASYLGDGIGDLLPAMAYETGKTGSGEPMNNMPPYITVYMWKRVA